jgi:hypothetical protein
MAAPNIVNVTSIIGNTATLNVTTVSSNIIANPAASGSVYKINSIVIANYDTANTADISASLLRGGVTNHIASAISIAYDTTLVLIDKDTSFYLAEGDALRLSASANNRLWATCSHEIIS